MNLRVEKRPHLPIDLPQSIHGPVLISASNLSGVEFGPIDTVKYAESFGAVGMRVKTSSELESVLKKALETPGPVVVEIPIDYSGNLEIGKTLHPDMFH